MISMIECSCAFCIYQENFRCTLDYVSISDAGMCLSGTHVYIDLDDLEKMKKAQREHLDKVDEELERQ